MHHHPTCESLRRSTYHSEKRKLRWYGHVMRSNGLSKNILQGTVQGKRNRDRQRKKWTGNIMEWTKKTFAET